MFRSVSMAAGLILGTGLLTTAVEAADPAWLPPIQRVAGWLDPGQAHPPTVRTEFELVCAGSASMGCSNLTAALTVRVPDRLHLVTGTNQSRVEFGRLGNQAWLWESGSTRWSLLRLPAPAPSIGFPIASSLVEWAAKGCDTTAFAPVKLDGETCSPFRVRPVSLARDYLGSSDFLLTLWIRSRDAIPLAVRWQDPAASTDLTVWMRRVRVDRGGAEGPWTRRPPAGVRIEEVSLEGFLRRMPAGFAFAAVELGALPVGTNSGKSSARPPREPSSRRDTYHQPGADR